MGHQQRRRHPLAGDVAEQRPERAALGAHQVAVIAAHRPQRVVQVADLPAVGADPAGRQQRGLHPRRGGQVVLQGARLVRRQAAEADAHGGIGEQAVALDRVPADGAEPPATRLQPLQGGVHLEQQGDQLGALGGVGHRREPPAPLQEPLLDDGRCCCRHQPTPPAPPRRDFLSSAIWPPW